MFRFSFKIIECSLSVKLKTQNFTIFMKYLICFAVVRLRFVSAASSRTNSFVKMHTADCNGVGKNKSLLIYQHRYTDYPIIPEPINDG